ncbi:Glutathione transport system permease protein GsiC [Candidatus Entotheonellaceae bacterium PAL068K]
MAHDDELILPFDDDTMHLILRIVAKRIALGFVSIIAISVLIFVGVEALPGDLAETILGQSATPETVAAFRQELQLDLPPHSRYVSWLGDFLRGELGTSLSNGRPIAEMIGWRLSNTVFLAMLTAVVSVPLAVALGMLAALYRYTWFDRLISISTLSTISLPEFFVAYILIALLSVTFKMFPSISILSDSMSLWQKLYVSILPCLTLTLVVVAHIMRMTRAAIINVLDSLFIEMAHLKGLTRSRIIVHHAFPNALSPIINVIVLNLAYLVVGVVVVEVVFVYPGLGQLLVDSVSKRDLPVVQASGLIFAGTYVLLNLTADVLAMLSNPKLRYPQ